jgi:hypothetical protein
LQVRTHAIRTAHENIDRTIKAADGILSQFDLARRVRSLTLSQKSERSPLAEIGVNWISFLVAIVWI